MPWEEIFKQLAVIIGGSAVAVAALAWLTKTVLSHWLSKDVERFKAQLQDTNTREIESLKNKLRMEAFEHETRFRKLHEKQAEVFAESWAALYDLFQKVGSYVNIIDWATSRTKPESLA